MLIQETDIGTQSRRTKQRVVCVDDEPLVRQALHRLLRHEPYEFRVAAGPEEALQYIREFDVDLVLTDQLMPGMTGVEFLNQVRRISPSTRGILVTAYPESVFAEIPPGATIPPLVSKPWDDDTLRETLRHFLQEERGDSKPELRPSSTSVTQATTLLVPLDGSAEAETALAVIMPLARRNPRAKIILVRVIDRASEQAAASEYLIRSRQALAAQNLAAVFWVQMGDPAKEIVACAQAAGADLITITSHGKRTLSSLLRGRVTERVIRKAGVPVLVSRPGLTLRPWKRILVPLDGTPESESILPSVVELGRALGSSLTLVRVAMSSLGIYGSAESLVTPLQPGQNPLPYLERVAARFRSEGLPLETAALQGLTTQEICRHADRSGTDLICMATHARPGFLRFLTGSVTQDLLAIAPCPVLVHPPVPRLPAEGPL